jgi:very-short-patch-repair endonuclease
MTRKKKQQRKNIVNRAKKNRKLDEYDARCYYKDLEYIARLSYIPESTRSWIEARMYELRASANCYEHNLGEMLIRNHIDFIHQAPFVFRPKTIYFCDFYIPSKRIVIEVDGIYHNGQVQLSKDLERDANLKSIGIRVIRIANEETKDQKRLALRLSQFLPELTKRSVLCLINLITVHSSASKQFSGGYPGGLSGNSSSQ